MKRTVLSLAVAGVVAGLTACGGGGGGGTGSAASLTGQAADGYLEQARVCLDINDNRVCDAGDPTTTTGEDGQYTLPITAGQDDGHSVLVEVVENVTVDKDTGTAIAKGYTLMAPAGEHGFISPLTTMVQNKLDANPTLSKDEAKGAVKRDLNIAADDTLDLGSNYVEEKANTGNSAELRNQMKRLHSVAQVIARTIGTNIAAVETAIGIELTAEQKAALVAVIVAQVADSLPTLTAFVEDNIDDESGEIKTEALAVVEADEGDTVDTTNVSGTFALDVTNVDTEELDNKHKEIEQATELVIANLATVMENGLFWVESRIEHNETGAAELDIEYQKIFLADSEGTLGFDRYEWDTDTGAFVVESDEDGHQYKLLGAEGFTLITEETETISFNDDGSAVLSKNASPSETIRAKTVGVSGEEIGKFLDRAWRRGVGTAPVFSTGAEAYKFAFSRSAGSYELHVWDGCDDPAATGGDCNTIYVQNSESGGPATSLQQVLDAQFVHVGRDLSARFLSNPVDAATPGEAQPALEEGSGVLKLYKFVYDNMGGSQQLLTRQGNWKLVTVQGTQLLMVDLPADLNETHEQGASPFLAVESGFVRQGVYLPASGVRVEDGWGFNKVAMEDILASFTPPTVEQVQPVNQNGGDSGTDTGEGGEGGEPEESTRQYGSADELPGTVAGSAFMSQWYFVDPGEGELIVNYFDDSGLYREWAFEPGQPRPLRIMQDGQWRTEESGTILGIYDGRLRQDFRASYTALEDGVLELNELDETSPHTEMAIPLQGVSADDVAATVLRIVEPEVNFETDCHMALVFNSDGSGQQTTPSCETEEFRPFAWTVGDTAYGYTLSISWTSGGKEIVLQRSDSDMTNNIMKLVVLSDLDGNGFGDERDRIMNVTARQGQ